MPAYNSHALSLYCDATQHESGMSVDLLRFLGGFIGRHPVVFYHADQKACRQLAKQAGWKFTQDGRSLCPRCAKVCVRLPKYRHDG